MKYAAVLGLGLLLSACSSFYQTPAAVSGSVPTVNTQALGATHTVQRGDTPFGIARRYGVPVANLMAWNGLSPPYILRIGQVLRLSSAAASAVTPVSQLPTRQVARGVLSNSYRSTASPSGAGCDRNSAWQWPVRGPIQRTFSKTGRRGLDIFGRLGQPVLAAASGQVAYSGPGVNGYYGGLIIIRHSASSLSVYAHNQQRLVREGEQVTVGRQIATMGTNSDNRPALHFEVSCHEKTHDPLLYLPKY